VSSITLFRSSMRKKQHENVKRSVRNVKRWGSNGKKS
jgi:hypothetical protein